MRISDWSSDVCSSDLAIIGALADTLENGGDVGAAAATAPGDLKASVDHLTGVRASIGARRARLDLEQTRAADAGAAREIERSAIEDTDTTPATTEFQTKIHSLAASEERRMGQAVFSTDKYRRWQYH